MFAIAAGGVFAGGACVGVTVMGTGVGRGESGSGNGLGSFVVVGAGVPLATVVRASGFGEIVLSSGTTRVVLTVFVFVVGSALDLGTSLPGSRV